MPNASDSHPDAKGADDVNQRCGADEDAREFDLDHVLAERPDLPLLMALAAARKESHMTYITVPVHAGAPGSAVHGAERDGSAQATRAIGAALPLVRRCVLVTLAVIKPWQRDEIHGAFENADMGCYLARYAIAFEVVQRHSTADTGSALPALAAAREDLPMTDARGQGRLRELALGEAMRTVLRDLALPVHLAH